MSGPSPCQRARHLHAVKFYAPWCAHCQKLEQPWSEVGEEHEDDPGLLIASVDCEDEESKPLCRKYGVTGYPTLQYFMPPDPVAEIFSGDRDAAGLTEFARHLSAGSDPPDGEQRASLCYLRAREKCSEEGKANLDRMQAMGSDGGVEWAREAYKELRANLTAARCGGGRSGPAGLSESDPAILRDRADTATAGTPSRAAGLQWRRPWTPSMRWRRVTRWAR